MVLARRTGGVSQSGGSLVGAFAASAVIRDQVVIVNPLGRMASSGLCSAVWRWFTSLMVAR